MYNLYFDPRTGACHLQAHCGRRFFVVLRVGHRTPVRYLPTQLVPIDRLLTGPHNPPPASKLNIWDPPCITSATATCTAATRSTDST